MKRSKVERKLVSKFGFEPKESSEGSHHRGYQIQIGDQPLITTRVSHDSSDIGPEILGQMANQVRVKANFFREMLQCNKSCSEYYEKVKNDPYPPFDIPKWKL